MRIVLKLAAGMFLGMCLVLAVHGWLTVRREVVTFHADKTRAAELLGHALAVATSNTWEVAGKQPALAFLQKVDAKDQDIDIRWVALKQATSAHPRCNRLTAENLRQLEGGQTLSMTSSASNESTLCTFIPVQVKDTRPGAIVIATSLADQQAYARSTVKRLGIAVLIILVVNLALSLGFGTFWLGRPIRKLVAKSRAVGGGHFETPLDLGGRDELADLGDEINQMSAKLARARDELEAEHQGHLAAENQLRHAERLATVGKLAAGIAHEIGTPLNVADAHAKMIFAGQVKGEGVTKSAQTISRQTKRITEMIQRLMRFARRKQPRKEPVDVLQLVLDTVGLLESFEKKSGATITVDHGTPVKALADGDQLQQVLTNLITNGIHAMPKGGQISVGVSSKNAAPPDPFGGPEQDYCCITVEDQGTGIAEANLPHIFDPFFTTKDVNKGTGLGLSVVHAIVRDHNGWIEVKSEVDEGTCFAIYLPKAVS